jgi:hypothetical protein
MASSKSAAWPPRGGSYVLAVSQRGWSPEAVGK